MAAYTYKLVSALVPGRIKESIEDYEGSCDYNGDLWIAAAVYIGELQAEIARLKATAPASDGEQPEGGREGRA